MDCVVAMHAFTRLSSDALTRLFAAASVAPDLALVTRPTVPEDKLSSPNDAAAALAALMAALASRAAAEVAEEPEKGVPVSARICWSRLAVTGTGAEE